MITTEKITLDQIGTQYIGANVDSLYLHNRVLDLERQNMLLTGKLIELEKAVALLMQDRLGLDSE